MKSASCVQRRHDLQHTLGQVAVVLLGDLSAVGWSLKHGWVVVHILHVDHHSGVVLLQVVWGRQAQLVLSRTTNNTLYSVHRPVQNMCEAHTFTSSLEMWRHLSGATVLYDFMEMKLTTTFINKKSEITQNTVTCIMKELVLIRRFNVRYINELITEYTRIWNTFLFQKLFRILFIRRFNAAFKTAHQCFLFCENRISQSHVSVKHSSNNVHQSIHAYVRIPTAFCIPQSLVSHLIS